MVDQSETGDLDKEMPKIFDRQTYKDIALAFIIFMLIISAFLLNYGIKIRNDEYCTSELLIDERTTQSLPATYLLNDTDVSLLQKFTWNPNDFEFSKDYYFCYSGNASTTNTLGLSIVNQEGKVLASDYVNDGIIYNRCVFLTNKLSLNNGDYVGLSCNNCNSTNQLIIDQHLLGEDQEIIYEDSSSTQFVVDKGLVYDFQYTKSCKPIFKTMINVFFTVAGLLLLIVIVLIGVRWLRDVISKGWGF